MLLDRADICRALGEDEFFPLFQPQVDLATGQLAGFEALARWQHPRLGVIPPDAFIPVLQKHGFIDTLTQRLMARIFAAGPLLPSALRLSINLAPLQLLDRTIPGRIAEAAGGAGFPLDRLTIEITEGAMIEDLPTAQVVTSELREIGCRLALDDFGETNSSLFRLRDLPFDELKIDRSSIHAASGDPASRAIVAAVIGLARGMGLATVAVGVEHREQAALVTELGCNRAQGWLFGKPAALAEIVPGMAGSGDLPARGVAPAAKAEQLASALVA
jgi:EAL domain-containing protein (putative c-di-GMP-specific phosphodiesterase class I)